VGGGRLAPSRVWTDYGESSTLSASTLLQRLRYHKVKLHVVSYDLDKPGQNYPAIITRLQQLGAKRVQFSQWMLHSTLTAEQLRDDLLRYLDANDRLLVIDATNAPMAWRNLQTQIATAFNLT